MGRYNTNVYAKSKTARYCVIFDFAVANSSNASG